MLRLTLSFNSILPVSKEQNQNLKKNDFVGVFYTEK
jgi:hypothetical protein